MNRTQVLDGAKAAVTGERATSYGAPEDNFRRCAMLWNVYLTGRSDKSAPISPHDVALMLGLLKVARLQGNPSHADSWLDLAGYAACGAEIATAPVPEAVTTAVPESPFVADWRADQQRKGGG